MRSHRLFVNALTFSRVPLIFAWLSFAIAMEYLGCPSKLAGCWYGVWACLAMLLSGLTDAFDGALARKWSVVTPLGKMADPLMDKVFYVVAFPGLTWLAMHQGESDAHALALLAFTILYILRDLWVTFMRSIGTMYGADVAAMWLGKVRTALSFPVAGWIYMYLAFHPTKDPFCESCGSVWTTYWLWSCYFFEAFMIALTLVSVVTYTRAYMPYLKKALERN